MRGKAGNVLREDLPHGITPAYAGKSTQVPFHYIIIRDHPRLCGEKLHEKVQLACRRGSPPPMRGKGFYYRLICKGSGITPAYAGKSTLEYAQKKLNKGSPPPMRGKGNDRKSWWR